MNSPIINFPIITVPHLPFRFETGADKFCLRNSPSRIGTLEIIYSGNAQKPVEEYATRIFDENGTSAADVISLGYLVMDLRKRTLSPYWLEALTALCVSPGVVIREFKISTTVLRDLS